MVDSIKIMSLNCGGVNNFIKARRILNYLKTHKTDIAILQESHLKNNTNILLKSSYFPTWFAAPGTNKSRGVMILISKHIDFVHTKTFQDPNGRFLFVNGTLNSVNTTLAAIYAPNSGQLSFIRNTLEELEKFREKSLILGADLNSIRNNALDKKSKTKKSRSTMIREIQSSYTPLNKIFSHYNLTDTWRQVNEMVQDFTFFSSSAQSHSRIDYILISPDLSDKIAEANIEPKEWSDHAAVVCKLILNAQSDRSFTWRFDNFF